MKTLFLIRHAKSDKSLVNISDFERPLNERGWKDAPVMGKILSKKLNKPDLIISSPAIRALTTAKLFVDQLDYDESSIQLCPEIYEASLGVLLKEVNKISDEHSKVIMFGHNPGFTLLFNYLTDNNLVNLPTCGIVKIDFDLDSWRLVSQGTGVSSYIDYPKNNI